MIDERQKKIEDKMRAAVSHAEIRRLAYHYRLDPEECVRRFGRSKVSQKPELQVEEKKEKDHG